MKENNKSKNKTFMGMPMNWDSKNILKTMWNPENDELFPPKAFGIGWSINFYVVCKKMGLVGKQK
jgi:hypothetical protein